MPDAGGRRAGLGPYGGSAIRTPPFARSASRHPTRRNTIDGQAAHTGLRPQNGTITLTIAGRANVPTGTSSVVLNVTATETQGSGFITVYPCDAPKPDASNLNYTTGQTIPNAVITKLDPNGQICLFNLAPTHLIVDIAGYFPTTDTLTPLPAPARLLDTRPDGNTIDGQAAHTGLTLPNTPFSLQVGRRAGIPANATSVILNVTVVDARASGYTSVYAGAANRPNASNLNYSTGQTIPNLVVSRLDSNGQICIVNLASSQLIVDVTGYLVGGDPPTAGTPCANLLTVQPLPPLPPIPPPLPPVPPVAPAPMVTIAPGTYGVGWGGFGLVAPGRYAMTASPGCYWERLSGFGGTLNEIIANDFQPFAGPVIVDIRLLSDTGFHFTSECGQMTLEDLVTYPSTPPITFVAGTARVGRSLALGTYSASSTGTCYWARLSAFGGGLAEIIANDFVSTVGPVIVTIAPTDVGFYSNDQCGTWTRI